MSAGRLCAMSSACLPNHMWHSGLPFITVGDARLTNAPHRRALGVSSISPHAIHPPIDRALLKESDMYIEELEVGGRRSRFRMISILTNEIRCRKRLRRDGVSGGFSTSAPLSRRYDHWRSKIHVVPSTLYRMKTQSRLHLEGRTGCFLNDTRFLACA